MSEKKSVPPLRDLVLRLTEASFANVKETGGFDNLAVIKLVDIDTSDIGSVVNWLEFHAKLLNAEIRHRNISQLLKKMGPDAVLSISDRDVQAAVFHP